MLKQRGELFRLLKIPEECQNYSLKLYWNHPALKSGLHLIDLPGLDSAVRTAKKAGKVLKSHDEITLGYVQKADAVMMIFTPEVQAGKIPDLLEVILTGERMKEIANKDSRIIPVINKADMVTNIKSSTNVIQGILYDLNVPYVYPVASMYGDYLHMKNGFPFERTVYYQNQLRDDEDLAGDEEMKLLYKKKLKNNYGRMFAYFGADGEKQSINLEGFVNMITRDYVDKMRCLKGLELLNAGLENYHMVITNIVTRLEILKYIRQSGDGLAETMIRTIDETGGKLVEEFSTEFTAANDEMIAELNRKDKDIDRSKDEYIKGIDDVEKKVSGIIKDKIGRMQKDFFGHMVIDKDGNDKAKSNYRIYNDMKNELQNFSVRDYLKKSNDQFKTTTGDIHKSYKNKIADLCGMYNSFAETFRQDMDKSYAAILKAMKEKGITEEEFEKHFKPLYNQLKEMVCVQVAAYVNGAASSLAADQKMEKAQNAAADQLASYNLAVEKLYQEAFTKYIGSAMGKTFFVEKDFFNYKGIISNVDDPFFSKETLGLMAGKVNDIYDDYKNGDKGVKSSLNRIKDEYTMDMKKDFVNNMRNLNTYIQHTVQAGVINIDSQIDEMVMRMKDFGNRISRLKDEVLPALDAMKKESWAEKDVKAVLAGFVKIEDTVNNRNADRESGR
ncbi:hypothetical protein [Clostridium sp. AM58-1XD]|uniref:hypothetical protein n=1 Tax=Clostridium sp. AM58-1XD TaxID=2292307 RepID=UPI000E53A8CE|nr:hypothetical protein [Clostridium sp. AM58-1XD]RGZ01906.1 hypothetical protein DXA13_00970 [Clostridium sp. AM58-1XD]